MTPAHTRGYQEAGGPPRHVGWKLGAAAKGTRLHPVQSFLEGVLPQSRVTDQRKCRELVPQSRREGGLQGQLGVLGDPSRRQQPDLLPMPLP